MNTHLRRAAKLLTAPALALAVITPALAVAATPAAAATAADAYTFSNGDGTLNATGNNDGNQISVTPDGTNYTSWRLIKLAEPGLFNIASTASGKCVYASQPAQQQSCGKEGEQWHFRPVDGKPNSFGIVRRDDSSGTEYCMDNRGGLHLWGILAQPNVCNGSASQEWKVPASKALEARSLALDYYADLCSKRTSTCSWTERSEGQPEALPRQIASSVWYNATDSTMKQIFTTIYHSGWEQSYSAGVSTSVGVTTPVQAMISSQLSATQTYSSDETTINGIAVDVPAKNYAWVDFAAVGKKVTGTWTFDTDNQPWTTDATVTVPVVNATAGSTMYIARTSTATPGSDTGNTRTDVKAQVLATTESADLEIPEGATATVENDTVRLTDATGKNIATVRPGVVQEPNGATHAVGLTLDGKKLTQTIRGVTGDTVTGAVTPPTLSVRDGVRVGGAALKDAGGSGTAAMAPAGLLDKPRTEAEWNKCMLEHLGSSIYINTVVGTATGAMVGGGGAVPGLAIGLMTGTVKGLGQAIFFCGTGPKK
ncbi:RICIN domain-containing protein [Streptomyces sp. NPDC059917]|uniref:RICIN domain-containing protein n=1 Tax=Streptomyces sp. NPDC059917 TaxID=3347002 RepID=UPI00365DE891